MPDGENKTHKNFLRWKFSNLRYNARTVVQIVRSDTCARQSPNFLNLGLVCNDYTLYACTCHNLQHPTVYTNYHMHNPANILANNACKLIWQGSTVQYSTCEHALGHQNSIKEVGVNDFSSHLITRFHERTSCGCSCSEMDMPVISKFSLIKYFWSH